MNLGGRRQARRGEVVDVLDDRAAGLIAELADRRGDGLRPVGLITWLAEPATSRAEIRAVAVDESARGQGVGRSLFEAAHEALAHAGAETSWLVTTNDNGPAIRLYASLGYRVIEIRRGAIDEIRRTIKPSIPLLGHDGVEMHDEIEMDRPISGP